MIDLLVAQILSLRQCVELVQAITGIKFSEATCLGYTDRLYDALELCEVAAKERIQTHNALHADEAGFRVNKKTQWLHVITDGSQTPSSPASQAGQGIHGVFRHHSGLHRFVDPLLLGIILCIHPVRASGMRVVSPSGAHLYRHVQRLQLGALPGNAADLIKHYDRAALRSEQLRFSLVTTYI